MDNLIADGRCREMIVVASCGYAFAPGVFSGVSMTPLDKILGETSDRPHLVFLSCGLNGGPLRGEGEYGAYLACNLFTDTESVYVGDDRFPKIMQDGRDGDEESGYIGNMKDSATAGFKYFDCKDVTGISIKTRGYAGGYFEVRTACRRFILPTAGRGLQACSPLR